MSAASFFRLLCLAAIWGGSFLFMRVAANTFGPAYLIEFRVAFAAVALLMIALYLRKRVVFFKHIKHFFIIGLFNSAVPFLLFAYAAQTLNASTLAILNSTAPIWGGFNWLCLVSQPVKRKSDSWHDDRYWRCRHSCWLEFFNHWQ